MIGKQNRVAVSYVERYEIGGAFILIVERKNRHIVKSVNMNLFEAACIAFSEVNK